MQLSRPFAEDLPVRERNSFLNMSSHQGYQRRVRQYPVSSFMSFRATKNPMQKPSEVVVEKFEYLP